jgi:predicted acetyltransferase
LTEKDRFIILPATPDDISVLVDHHRKMFEEVLMSRKVDPKTLNPEKLDKEYVDKLTNELGISCHMWVAKKNNREVVASGGVSIISMVPVPNDYSCKVAYIHSIFTENKFRNNGLAERIMERMLQFCKQQCIKRLILNASDAGRPLYEKIGFEVATNSMRMSME